MSWGVKRCVRTVYTGFQGIYEGGLVLIWHLGGKIDATKMIDNYLFALEWETGNISSSHRAINKMVLGLLRGVFLGAALVLPSRKIYPYLTDRIGNYEELEPYFDVWKAVQIKEGFLAIFVIEHDYLDSNVPTLTKGIDGRALA